MSVVSQRQAAASVTVPPWLMLEGLVNLRGHHANTVVRGICGQDVWSPIRGKVRAGEPCQSNQTLELKDHSARQRDDMMFQSVHGAHKVEARRQQ